MFGYIGRSSTWCFLCAFRFNHTPSGGISPLVLPVDCLCQLMDFLSYFKKSKPVIAMIHTGPGPGVPGYVSLAAMVKRALDEAEIYLAAGVDGLL